ncbi:RNA polymerase sigma-70 factor [Granulicella sp. dw_53]|uniref:RNA polymerase sigma-70 factor n=1 Tax=Granulicella sp. dw_53 TaxID=2719792 RepID=UPI001BD46AE8|nr:RNA polymerase sigma-70 factor [Granulicella sp. dw_53]
MQPERPGETDTLDHAASVFVGVRPRLFGIAYRMLGSSAEAEDLVQDVWLKWQATDRSVVLDAAAFLSTMTTRLAINVVQSARSRRETYVGPWLPEPVDTSADPELGAVRGEALQFAVLLLLEKLSPTERASYVLREAFDYPYREIADILQLSEANTRQLVTRARKHIADERSARVTFAEQRRLLEAFIAAARKGDTASLEALFASDIVSYSDGGGVARAARIPILGRARVAEFISAFASHFWTGVTLSWIEANGQASVLLSRDGVVFTLATVDASPEGIDQILWMMNPAKLAAISSPNVVPGPQKNSSSH